MAFRDLDDMMKFIYKCIACESSRDKERDFYYYSMDAKIGMMMQNPGLGRKKKKHNNSSIMGYKEKFQNDLKGLINWIMKANYSFFKEFFDELIDRNIIDYEDYDSYVSTGDIFKDIYFFDAVKCKMHTQDLKEEHLHNCMINIVSHELGYFRKMELLFVFSTRAWESFKKQYKPKIISGKIEGSLAKVHGYLHSCQINGKILYVIPLVHMSPVSRNNLLRNSYFDYLKEGLDQYESIRSTGSNS